MCVCVGVHIRVSLHVAFPACVSGERGGGGGGVGGGGGGLGATDGWVRRV